MLETQKPRGVGFRGDIEGLRAIAVLAVTLFHFDFPFLEGGFVGVDMFFVISGYLITRNMVLAIGRKDFTFVGFYTARLYRIIPASAVTILATLVVAGSVFPPDLFMAAANSAVWSSLFLANVHFSAADGYFSPGAALQPLLHLWSLAVEEQFYLLWPAALVGLMQLPLRTPARLLMMVAIFVALVAISEIWLRHNGIDAYFWSPPRFFEFIAGGALVFMDRLQEALATVFHYTIHLLGLVVTATVILIFNEHLPFPGLTALPITLATAAMIFSGERAPLNAIYANVAMRLIGRISYSLYLVHWPVVVFYKYIFGEDIDWIDLTVLMAMSFVLAYVLYRGIEKPFLERGRRHRAAETRSYGRIATIAVLLIGPNAGIAFAASRLEASHWRLSPQQAETYVQNRSLRGFGARCDMIDVPPRFLCAIGNIEADERSLVIVGDSHSRRWRTVFADLLYEEGASGLVATFNGCVPLLGVSLVHERTPGWFRFCKARMQTVFNHIIEDPEIDTVVLAARWSFYVRSTRLGESRSKGRVYLSETGTVPDTLEERTAIFESAVTRTVDRLTAAGKSVVFVSQGPNLGYDLDRCLFSPVSPYLPGCDARSREQVRVDLAGTDLVLRAIGAARPDAVFVIDPVDVFCTELCRLFGEDTILYVDSNHINGAGVAEIFAANRASLTNFLRQPSDR
jgi:Predicted acyltransferases